MRSCGPTSPALALHRSCRSPCPADRPSHMLLPSGTATVARRRIPRGAPLPFARTRTAARFRTSARPPSPARQPASVRPRAPPVPVGPPARRAPPSGRPRSPTPPWSPARPRWSMLVVGLCIPMHPPGSFAWPPPSPGHARAPGSPLTLMSLSALHLTPAATVRTPDRACAATWRCGRRPLEPRSRQRPRSGASTAPLRCGTASARRRPGWNFASDVGLRGHVPADWRSGRTGWCPCQRRPTFHVKRPP